PRPLSTSSPPAAATLVASTLSLHDALPIFLGADARLRRETVAEHVAAHERVAARVDVDPEGGRGDLRRLDPVVLLRLGVRLAALRRERRPVGADRPAVLPLVRGAARRRAAGAGGHAVARRRARREGQREEAKDESAKKHARRRSNRRATLLFPGVREERGA